MWVYTLVFRTFLNRYVRSNILFEPMVFLRNSMGFKGKGFWISRLGFKTKIYGWPQISVVRRPFEKSALRVGLPPTSRKKLTVWMKPPWSPKAETNGMLEISVGLRN